MAHTEWSKLQHNKSLAILIFRSEPITLALCESSSILHLDRAEDPPHA